MHQVEIFRIPHYIIPFIETDEIRKLEAPTEDYISLNSFREKIYLLGQKIFAYEIRILWAVPQTNRLGNKIEKDCIPARRQIESMSAMVDICMEGAKLAGDGSEKTNSLITEAFDQCLIVTQINYVAHTDKDTIEKLENCWLQGLNELS